MARRCSICDHAAREAIDRALVSGTIISRIVAEYRDCSADALYRHRDAHLAVLVAQAQQARAGTERDQAVALATHADQREERALTHALDIVAQLKAINVASLAILKEARTAQEPDTALRAIDRIQKQIELQARLIGDLDERPVINILLAPEWLSVRHVILDALTAFPEAKLAVAHRLAAMEGSSARG